MPIELAQRPLPSNAKVRQHVGETKGHVVGEVFT